MRVRRNLYGSLAVLAVVAAISLGLPILDEQLPSHRTLPAGIRQAVGHGVTVLPPAGSVVDLTRTFPSRGLLVLDVGSVRIVLEAAPYRGSLADLAARLRRKIQTNPGYQASQPDHPTRTTSGVPGLRGSYSTPGRVGLYAVFLSGGVGVEISFAGSEADLRHGTEPVLAMVGSIQFSGDPA